METKPTGAAVKVLTYQAALDFLAAAGSWLEDHESVNNLMLGIAARLAATGPGDPPAVMVSVSDGNGPAAAAVMTRPRGLVLAAREGAAPDALEALADALLAGGHAVPECVGPSETAAGFAQIWARRTGTDIVLKMAQRIYELREVVIPVGVPGAPRLPRPEELDLCADWTHRFALECTDTNDPAAARTSAERNIGAGQTLFWEHRGQPVSMAAAVRPTRHGVAIGGVYTPPEHRGRGYASACVADLSRRQLAAGRMFCCLYTDLANPTSNRIYQKIGYRQVADSSHYLLNQTPA